MSKRGYTLIELLVVLVILSLIGMAAFARLKPFSKEKALDKSLDQIQTMLRLAQSNATAAVKCGNDAASYWLVEFKTNKQEMALKCKSSSPQATDSLKQELKLEDHVEIDSISQGSACQTVSFPSYTFTILYTTIYGKTEFIVAKGEGALECIADTTSITINLKRQTISKAFTLSKGGAIDVQQ